MIIYDTRGVLFSNDCYEGKDVLEANIILNDLQVECRGRSLKKWIRLLEPFYLKILRPKPVGLHKLPSIHRLTSLN